MTDEQKAFLAAQPAYDAAEARAAGLGAPPETLNALLAPDTLQLREITVFPLTLGGFLLLEATQNAWLGGREPTLKDNAVVALALTSPEWVRGSLSFSADCEPVLDRAALAAKLTEVIHRTPGWAWPGIIRHLQQQLAAMAGQQCEPEDSDPLVLTPGAAATPPAATATPATPVGSA